MKLKPLHAQSSTDIVYTKYSVKKSSDFNPALAQVALAGWEGGKTHRPHPGKPLLNAASRHLMAALGIGDGPHRCTRTLILIVTDAVTVAINQRRVAGVSDD